MRRNFVTRQGEVPCACQAVSCYTGATNKAESWCGHGELGPILTLGETRVAKAGERADEGFDRAFAMLDKDEETTVATPERGARQDISQSMGSNGAQTARTAPRASNGAR